MRIAIVLLAAVFGGTSLWALAGNLAHDSANPVGARILEQQRMTPSARLLAGSSDDHLHSCLACCDQLLSDCSKSKDSGYCATEHQNCVNHCNSQGETPAGWACWRKTQG